MKAYEISSGLSDAQKSCYYMNFFVYLEHRKDALFETHTTSYKHIIALTISMKICELIKGILLYIRCNGTLLITQYKLHYLVQRLADFIVHFSYGWCKPEQKQRTYICK